jgi:hypothetical protein
MKHRTTSLVALVALLGGCGGAGTTVGETALEPGTAEPAGPAMTGAVLTTAVDPNGESAAPASAAFALDTERIHLIAELTGLAPGTVIEVRWSSLPDGEPLHRSRDTGSGDRRLVAVLPAPPGGFEAGDYRVSVHAGDSRLGQTGFRIGGRTQDWTGVRGLLVASAITAWTAEAIEPKSSFPDGTRRIYAVFQVRTNDPRPFVRVTWLKDEKELAVNDLECGREVRCADAYDKGGKVPPGDYEVEITVNGEVMARRGFHVGGDPVGPVLLHAALGVAAGKKKQMPKRHSDVFEGRTSGLRCGVRLSTLPDEAAVRVAWVAVTDNGEEERYAAEEIIRGGGTGTAVVDWPVGGTLEPGRYKAVVSLGSRTLEELAFTVE